jgi:hypothetical protein
VDTRLSLYAAMSAHCSTSPGPSADARRRPNRRFERNGDRFILLHDRHATEFSNPLLDEVSAFQNFNFR